MAYADVTKKTLDSPLEWTACLTKVDCLVLRPKIKEMLFVTQKQFKRLEEIYESGEPTEQQKKSCLITKQRYESLASTLMAIEDVIKEQKDPVEK